MLIWKVRGKEAIASHKSKNYFMKSKHFSNDFENKTEDFPDNTNPCLKRLSVLVFKTLNDAYVVIDKLKDPGSKFVQLLFGIF